MRFLILILLLSLTSHFAPSGVAYAADGDVEFDDAKKSVYDLPETVAIQKRRYQMGSSSTLTAGYVPVDSFNHAYAFAGAYKYALSNYFTWEVISFAYVLNNETQLKQDLLNAGVEVKNIGLGGVLDYPRQIYMTGFHYSPMYSKSLVFNSKLTYSETSLFLGFGALNFNKVGAQPMVAPGLTTRIYVSQGTALTGYFRDYFYKDANTGITGIIDFGIGLEFKISDMGRLVPGSQEKGKISNEGREP